MPMASVWSAAGLASGTRLWCILSNLAGGSRSTARRSSKIKSRLVTAVMESETSTSADGLMANIAVRPMTADDMVHVALCEEVGYPDLARVGLLEGAYGLSLVSLPAASRPTHIYHRSLLSFLQATSPLSQCELTSA